MQEQKFKYRFGLYLILSHLIIIISLVLLRIMGGFDQEEFSTLLGIIMPMFSGFTTAILFFIIEDRHNTSQSGGQPLSSAYRFLAFTFTSLFILAITTCVWLQAFNLAFDNFEDFKAFILSVESVFAVYCGYLVYAIFKKIVKPEGQNTATTNVTS